jgi:hypothetical protein
MGTPRVSGSLDQMRRIQISAKGGGECAMHFTLETMRDSVANWTGNAKPIVAGTAATFC